MVEWGVKKMYRFSRQFMTFPRLFIFDPQKFPLAHPRYEPFADLSAYACQIWSQSDGRVENRGIQTDTHTQTKGQLHLYILVDVIM